MIDQLWDEVYESAHNLHKRLVAERPGGIPIELEQRIEDARSKCCALASELMRRPHGQLLELATDSEVNDQGLRLANQYASLVLEAARTIKKSD